MDCLTFVSKVNESLAWPIASIVLVFILREQIQRLAPSLKRLKAGPLEAEFEREVAKVSESAPKEVKERLSTPPEKASQAFLFHLADLHARSAIQEAWIRMEAAARALLSVTATATTSGYVPAARLTDHLVQHQFLSEGQANLFHELRRLRNEVAHQKDLEPSLESARSYVEMAGFLQNRMESQVPKPG